MPRRPKFPGLQERYQTALVSLLAGRTLKAREIVQEIRAKAAEFGISDEERDDLDKNFANYTARAKEAHVVVSSGPWGGYALGGAPMHPAGSAPGASTRPPSSTPSSPPTKEELSSEPAEKRRQHWESLLHLPLTVAMSSHFSARVLSLSNATDNVKWGNPDMLMLRASPLARVEDFDPALNADFFRLVDVTPECILASIEVKGGLDRDRASLFTSIAEAAANSRWANEAWLVFVDWQQSEQRLSEDVVSLARSVEVGLLEAQVLPDSSALSVTVHHAAPTRATLRVGDLTQERVGVLREAQDLLQQWQEGTTTFLDVDFAEQKARLLMEQALQNLRRQKGFIGGRALEDLLRPFRKDCADNEYVTSVLQATLRTAAVASGIDEENDLVTLIGDAADAALVKKAADAFRTDLKEFAPPRSH